MMNELHTKPIILFDGVCNLCSGIVQFIIKRDPDGKFLFAPLQSKVGKVLLEKFNLQDHPIDSFVYVKKNEHYVKSTAALHVVKDLGGCWKLLYPLIIIPRSVRDKVYDWIAKNRYKWFGQKESCMVPDSSIIERFLD
ncbi:thiol-disulfide oxidoreductase DCC family protein [Fictibacillus gelatini]|uniref:thiol-disulfide oxidoreductase DCC family protein n=1 Tax=Fictibacillus gelatini TaxID=225985 RepID=UPI0038994B35